MTTPGHTPESPDTSAGTSAAASCCGGGSPEDLGTPTTQEHTAEAAPESGCCSSDAAAAGVSGATRSTGSDDSSASGDEAAGGCCGSHGEASVNNDDAAADTEGADSERDELAEAIEAQQRLAAEYANFRRRTERDRATIGVVAKADVIAELLPVIDDLDLAKKHGDLTGPLKAVNDKLRAAFTKHKVTQFGEEGDAFNPDIHEAVQDQSTTDNKVLGAVLRPGFMIGDRLIRTAMVTIADGQ